eukprot:scaffold5224_cov31-Tisochrysis_lutea.AAC.2
MFTNVCTHPCVGASSAHASAVGLSRAGRDYTRRTELRLRASLVDPTLQQAIVGTTNCGFLFAKMAWPTTVAYAPAPGQLRHSGGGFRDSLPCHGAGCDMEELPEDVDPMLEAALLNSIPGF